MSLLTVLARTTHGLKPAMPPNPQCGLRPVSWLVIKEGGAGQVFCFVVAVCFLKFNFKAC